MHTCPHCDADLSDLAAACGDEFDDGCFEFAEDCDACEQPILVIVTKSIEIRSPDGDL